uniref:RNase H type-1 domain-containing protein n=1 Tax=Cajanus cajan TaxID=3821 RepID=A0A151RAT0_CAJCA|nr:hypothetical protein KK1_039082 [Cajanus cajan]
MAELHAIFYGLKLTWEVGLTHVCETNSLAVLHLFSSDDIQLHLLGVVIRKIQCFQTLP